MKSRWGKAYTTRVHLELAERFDAYCTAMNRSAYSVLSLLVGQLMEEQNALPVSSSSFATTDEELKRMIYDKTVEVIMADAERFKGECFGARDIDDDEASLGDVADACAGDK